ncbi:MAG: hypothetical protein BLM47_05630 [Candidatus Reconcilbacillus cellulovorans]|uniref:HEPN domain-containing protein n=1 Tax=Candidatus Reconcilbacillus cellulovorans TaxID=1906605 RepID=A0A2A6E186_9BACL|nr:MAG: hypothetical protein BLM47_05630 [Candidatus Reconcilbacillus cellulovorans]
MGDLGESRKTFRKDVYREAARQRLAEAGILKDKGRWHTAVYLCGFVLECMLAYAYCDKYPHVQYLHDVPGFDKDKGIKEIWFDHNRLVDKAVQAGFGAYVKDFSRFQQEWRVEMRYHPDQFVGRKEKAKELFHLALRLYKMINSRSV